MTRPTIVIMLILTALTGSLFAGLALQPPNGITFGGVGFNLELTADQRVAENSYQPITFSSEGFSSSDSLWIVFSSEVMDLTLSFSPRPSFSAGAYLARAQAVFKQETWLHELYLSMQNPSQPVFATLKGAAAIQNNDPGKNLSLMPFRDMAAEFHQGENSFWIVASNLDECGGLEGMSSNQITLYDYKAHFFRIYNPVTNQTDLLRDTLYRPSGSSFSWSFMLFDQKPPVPQINRWPHGKLAALCISNDADGETLTRLQAVFEGSSDPSNPKYYTKGFFARNIPISNTIFGVYQPILGDMWHSIKDHGSRIGYHTYTLMADPPGANAQALLTDLLPYDIRMWIDHALLQNPEDLGHYGLNPDHESFVGDVINASGIDYVWSADTPPTNPFDVYEEAWRLPHRVWEATAFTRPIWFHGRTRMEVWAYNNGWSMLGLKYLMTPDNLDRLIANRGLHICYTHLCATPNSVVTAFYQINDDGSHEVRDDVDDMLVMLDDYRSNRGLWIAPVEDIFDRMLAIEEVKVVESGPIKQDGTRMLLLKNCSGMDISGFNFSYKDRVYSSPLFLSGSSQTFFVRESEAQSGVPQLPDFIVAYNANNLQIKSRDGLNLPSMQGSVYNLRGQHVDSFELRNPASEVLIPFSGKASGIYLVRFRETSGKLSQIRFTVIR